MFTELIICGLILGPLLFLLYINDMSTTSRLLKNILFADDTNVFLSHKSLDHLIEIMNSELIIIANWFKTNRSSLNLDKNQLRNILFTKKKSLAPSNPFISMKYP